MENKAIIILSIIFLFLIINGCAKENINVNNTKGTREYQTISTGSTQIGDVLIELTPVAIENNNLKINFVANTHSVDLNQFDLMQITTWEYNGKQLKPLSVPALSGHHSSGELIFNIDKIPKNFKIIIKNIPNVEERVFEWL